MNQPTRIVPMLGLLQGDDLARFEERKREEQSADTEDAVEQLRRNVAALQADQIDLRRELDELRGELRTGGAQ